MKTYCRYQNASNSEIHWKCLFFQLDSKISPKFYLDRSETWPVPTRQNLKTIVARRFFS